MTITHDPAHAQRLWQEALAIFQGLPEERQKELMEEQRKSVEENARRDAERRQLEARPEPFQAECQRWLDTVTEGDPTDLEERRARFLEESLEWVQSLGMSLIEVIQVAAYVFGRPAGEPGQEAGGVNTTAMVLAQYVKLDFMECGRRELDRCWDPAVIEKIRGKRSRRHGRGPLPGTSAPEADLVPAPKGSTLDPFYSGCGDRTGPR